MGLYDRDYGRQERTPWDRMENPRSIVTILIIVNVVVFFADALSAKNVPGVGRASLLADWFAISSDTLPQPWFYFRVLTYGFLHSIGDIFHILFNMFVLYVFGRNVEMRIGRDEFLRFYLLAIIAGGAVAMMLPLVYGLFGSNQAWSVIGASGGVVAVTVLFACLFPQVEVLFMFLFPIKAWVLATLLVLVDFAGALGIMGSGSNTAFEVHLAGALFGFLYYQLGWSFRRFSMGWLTDMPDRLRQRSRCMKLKLHDPDQKIRVEAQEADRILAKIHESGESSLTSAERRTLQRYSRRQREKRDDG
ncbi:MAG: rhomboid family intramembrane serine protease [Planctomycetota bacterium]